MDYFKIVLAFLLAGITAFAVTPLAKRFAYVIGAVDVPRDNRRMHKEPIPRAGGLAFFAGFLVAILIFGTMDRQMMTVLIGCLIIVTLGILDDILQLPAWIKFIAEVAAASIPVVWGGLRIEFFTNFNLVSDQRFFYLGYLSIPVTILWIVGVTNAVNMIDGLDGLAAGISTISSVSLLVVCCVTGDLYVAVVMACLAGGLMGFLPYNFNPAQIFMGDTGSNFLGFLLGSMSVLGLFKFYTVVSFGVPFLILGLPLYDMIVVVFRRILSGRSPMSPDRGHIHHRLVDMGFNQKQAVGILYGITLILGIIAIVLALGGAIPALIVLFCLLVIGVIVFRIVMHPHRPAGSAPTSEIAPEAPSEEAPEEPGEPQTPSEEAAAGAAGPQKAEKTDNMEEEP